MNGKKNMGLQSKNVWVIKIYLKRQTINYKMKSTVGKTKDNN